MKTTNLYMSRKNNRKGAPLGLLELEESSLLVGYLNPAIHRGLKQTAKLREQRQD